MQNRWEKLSEKFASLNEWYAQSNEESLCHPLICEFKNRLFKIDALLTGALTVDNDKSVPEIPTMKEMIITFQLNRCEAIKQQIKGGLNPPDQKIVDRILYPSVYIAYLQNFIRLIMTLKKRLNLNRYDYTASSVRQLFYIKYPVGLTKFFARLIERLRAF